MTDAESFPLSRIFAVDDLTPEGVDFVVDASKEECVALASFLDLPVIHNLKGVFRLTGTTRRVTVTGEVTARLAQLCSVSLEPFDTDLVEEVEVFFAEAGTHRPASIAESPLEVELMPDEPDELIDGKIDLGSLTAEFLALGLDPYPRKPGVEFSFETDTDAPDSPFSALSGLKESTRDNKN